jgi:choline monooxygenase
MADGLRAKLAAYNPELTLDQASTIPSLWYHDAEVYNHEIATIFRRTWQLVGRADQVAEPGSFFTAEVGEEPLIVSRDKQGTLRAFSNVCRHRAARVERRCEGKANAFACRYHGWSYDLAGQLQSTPEWDGVKAFRREENGLPQWSVATWGPWVFAHWGKPTEPLESFLAHVPGKMPGIDLSSYWFFRRASYDLECNWKVFVDNYLDGGYHIRTIHPTLSSVINYATYRTEIEGRSSVQISPLKSQTDSAYTSVRSGDAAYYWWIHPNLMLNLYENTMDTNLVQPLGPTRCRVHIDFFATGARDDKTTRFMEKSIEAAHAIQLEDVDICEDAYRGIRSDSYDTGRFSVKREAPGYHFHRLLARELKGAV